MRLRLCVRRWHKYHSEVTNLGLVSALVPVDLSSMSFAQIMLFMESLSSSIWSFDKKT
ncbi:hypothetical protein BDQ12DRAFT_364824 [Crucibulum laeve]|uniref:Uncharacterized protein n=1 Tax=Crucibulum laeve TaxID=68775 RepID=A0A5C3LP41_9AGAR|nr:hypothetical protein BDQ12DRAFT_364824 [Crucibulum laeve]